jgi:uncharacterized protein GlcG (DUF336 family)
VDNGGNLVSFLRMPAAFLHSIDIAIDKAYTAAGFGFATGDWQDILPAGTTFREGIQMRPRLVSFGGGIPILVDGDRIGAIGVSGGSEEQDTECAEAGIAAVLQLSGRDAAPAKVAAK